MMMMMKQLPFYNDARVSNLGEMEGFWGKWRKEEATCQWLTPLMELFGGNGERRKKKKIHVSRINRVCSLLKKRV